jgi:hypothetical protein
MGSTLVSILPMIVGSALVPVQIMIVILILTGREQPVAKALAFVGGMTVARLLQGVLFGLVFGNAAPADGGEAGTPWITSTLLVVLGLFLLITAYRTFNDEPDPDAPPPKWMTMMDGVSVGRSFVMGAGLIMIAAKLWVFTLGAISEIADAGLDLATATVTFLIYILLAQSLLILPIAIRALVPSRATALLDATSAWLNRHNKAIVVTVSVVFGIFFLFRGINAIL